MTSSKPNQTKPNQTKKGQDNAVQYDMIKRFKIDVFMYK